jgi:diadenosine tetraphosphate (Ap4A) HIT family hydrolase
MTKAPDCFMCQDSIFEKGTRHPIKIAELGVSTAILNRDWQFYKGSTLLVFHDHERELHHLDPATQHRFIDDASRVAAALEKTYPVLKINHGLLGNAAPHLHWHLIVRRDTDPHPRLSIWESKIPKVDLTDVDYANIAGEIYRNL